MPYIDGLPIGQLPLVIQLLRGILQNKPSLPRYQYTWDIDIVLKSLLKLPANKNFDLKTLGKKLAILLALTSPKRVSDISRLDRRFMATRNDSIVFHLPGLSKTQKGCSSRTVKYCKFGTKKICVVACIPEYEKRRSTVRPCTKSEPDPLLRATKKTFKGISSQTMANWITSIMSEAGLDVMAFKAHACRMASTSKAALLGVNIPELLDMVAWSNASTFTRFYFKSELRSSFCNKVLQLVSNTAIYMHCYISRRFLKYNFRFYEGA